MNDSPCRHVADVSLKELSRCISAGKAMINGEITGWRFKCRDCGAYLMYTNSFAKSRSYWYRTNWWVTGIAILPPLIALMIWGMLGGAESALVKLVSTPWGGLLAALALMALLLICGKLGNLLFCLLIKHGRIGKFVAVPYESWLKLTPPEDSLKSPERQKEIRVQRIVYFSLICFFVVLTLEIFVLATVLNK